MIWFLGSREKNSLLPNSAPLWPSWVRSWVPFIRMTCWIEFSVVFASVSEDEKRRSWDEGESVCRETPQNAKYQRNTDCRRPWRDLEMYGAALRLNRPLKETSHRNTM